MAQNQRTKTIKEFIYIDEIELNSILAQLDNGLTTVIHDMQQALSGNTESNSKTKTHQGSGGISTFIKAEGGYTESAQNSIQDINQSISQEAADTVYNDYAVDIILKELRASGQLYADKRGVNHPAGSFILVDSPYKIFDFEETQALTSNPDFKKLIEDQGGDISPTELQDQLDSLDKISSIANVYREVTKGTDLLSIEDGVVFAESKNFRMNSTQRKMLSLRKSKIKVFGIVEARVSESDMDMDSFTEHDDLSGITDFAAKSNFFLLSVLGEKFIKNNDRLIKPVAIYFE
ncbi:DUF6414 family protein [Levilactobacillus bambusae]|uniref:Uncharacterized protein n=1 Tax=Levilactobacillus bambusae TaxID=2024736 RepID=A0A2V1N125_9LACO|nr:hypothetical protein [Levilactobacillus bambusae]PWG00991.1 hypothetical protein DCM90_02115 [Levilactobacillus bambusae]